jgi:hypothetical protein
LRGGETIQAVRSVVEEKSSSSRILQNRITQGRSRRIAAVRLRSFRGNQHALSELVTHKWFAVHRGLVVSNAHREPAGHDRKNRIGVCVGQEECDGGSANQAL